MRNTKVILISATVACVAAACMLSARMTSAQGPEGTGAARSSGQRPGPGIARPAANLGTLRAQMPIVLGTVTESDAGTGTITLTSQFGGGDQTIRVTPGTRYSTITTLTVEDLKVNDKVQVQGVPTGISAANIVAGDLSDFLTSAPQAKAGPAPAAAAQGAAANTFPRAAAAPAAVPASATATGTVTSISPLTISVGPDVSIVLKLDANAKVSKISPSSFAKLKPGDQIIATGQAGAAGAFNATAVGINLDYAVLSSTGLGPVVLGVSTPSARVAAAAEKPAEADFAEVSGSATDPNADNGAAAVQLLQANCGCHNGNGRGPDLSHEGSKRSAAWLSAFIANPQSKMPGSKMPAMAGKVPNKDIVKMANYLAGAK